MGQEASLPLDGSIGPNEMSRVNNELEHQARAPPSSTNPRTGAASGLASSSLARAKASASKASSVASAATQKLNPRQSSGKIMNAVFNRPGSGGGNAASRAVNGGTQLASGQPNHHHLQSMPQGQHSPQKHQSNLSPSGRASQNSHNGSASWNQSSSSTRPGMISRVASVGKVASLRSSGKGAGAAILNSMKNLSISNPLHRSNNGMPSAKAQGKDVNEWETRWDEDEDDGDSDEEEESLETPPMANYATGARINAPIHLQTRPGMDMGHSSAVPTSQLAATYPPTTETHPKSPIPSHPGNQNSSVSPNADYKPPRPQPNQALTRQKSDDGIEWDTGAIQQEIDERPNVEMFLPLLRVLGKGSFGKVVLVQKQTGKERGALFAMKILRKTHLVKRRQIERTRTERKVLSVVNHPFIMKLHYAFQSPDKLYLVLDYCPGGELFFHLSRFRRFPERVTRFYAAELLLAIGHLHKRGLIYRDLKPENVLLDAEGHVKLGDFGLAKAGIKHPCEGATSMCGTPEYMAPEVLSHQGHGFCVDYWGLGMLVYEMMTGLPPWYTTDRAKLFRRLKSAPLDIPTYFSPQASSCVSSLLERNPRHRLGVTGIRAAMEHDFFRSISWRSLYGRHIEAPIRPCEGWTAPEAISDSRPHYEATGDASGQVRDIENLNVDDLDAATANFDNTFTRMPVETEDKTLDNASDEGDHEELHEDTFVGFTFDNKDRDEIVAVQTSGQEGPKSHTMHRQID